MWSTASQTLKARASQKKEEPKDYAKNEHYNQNVLYEVFKDAFDQRNVVETAKNVVKTAWKSSTTLFRGWTRRWLHDIHDTWVHARARTHARTQPLQWGSGGFVWKQIVVWLSCAESCLTGGLLDEMFLFDALRLCLLRGFSRRFA